MRWSTIVLVSALSLIVFSGLEARHGGFDPCTWVGRVAASSSLGGGSSETGAPRPLYGGRAGRGVLDPFTEFAPRRPASRFLGRRGPCLALWVSGVPTLTVCREG